MGWLITIMGNLEFDKLKEQHTAVFENEEIDAVGDWGFKSSTTDSPSDEKYNFNKDALKGLGSYIKRVLNQF